MNRPLASLIAAVAAITFLTSCGPKKATRETGDLASKIHNSGIVLVDFTEAANAGCEQMKPIVEKAVAKYAGKLTHIIVDVKAHPQIAAGYGVTTLPHFALMNGNEEVPSTTGIMTETDFAKWLAKNLATALQ